jgi:hypothetical protein
MFGKLNLSGSLEELWIFATYMNWVSCLSLASTCWWPPSLYAICALDYARWTFGFGTRSLLAPHHASWSVAAGRPFRFGIDLHTTLRVHGWNKPRISRAGFRQVPDAILPKRNVARYFGSSHISTSRESNPILLRIHSAKKLSKASLTELPQYAFAGHVLILSWVLALRQARKR